MYQISNEKFGLFVTELRKKKNLTQKDLLDGCFFNEMPSDVDGKQVGVIILSDQDGNKIMAIKGVKLSGRAG